MFEGKKSAQLEPEVQSHIQSQKQGDSQPTQSNNWINNKDVIKLSPILFAPGQIIRHKKYGYRGVIFEVDECFKGTESWYKEMALGKAPKHRPWYRVLVDGSTYITYVAEQHLELDAEQQPVEHPLIFKIFTGYTDGRYQRLTH